MMKRARFGKAVGKELDNIGDSVRSTIEDFPNEGPFILEEWKAEQSRYKLVVNRLKTKNLTIWNPNKEA